MMNENHELPTNLADFASQLASLSADRGRLDRDRVLFLAGAASVERAGRSARFWRRACGGVSAVAALLLVGYFLPAPVADSQPLVATDAAADRIDRTPPLRRLPSGVLTTAPRDATQLLAARPAPRTDATLTPPGPIDLDAERRRPSRAALLKAAAELTPWPIDPLPTGASS